MSPPASDAPSGNCPRCGSPVPPDARFCGNCGHVMSAAPSAPSVAPAKAPMRTMIGAIPPGMAPQGPTPPQAPEAPARLPIGGGVPLGGRTMIGAVPPGMLPPSPSPAPRAAVPPGMAAPPGANANRTMIGAAGAAPPGIVPPGAKLPSASRTMVGGAQVLPPGVPVRGGQVANANRTMMGAMAPMSAGGGSVANANRTMTGAAAPSSPGAIGPASSQPFAPSSDTHWAEDGDDEPVVVPRRRRVWPWLLGALATVAVAGGAVYAFTRYGATPAVPLAAHVESSETGALAVRVSVPGETPGTTVRYGSQQRPVEADGTVHFALENLDGRIGAIDLPVEIRRPSGESVARTARIRIGYRVDPDLTGLVQDHPMVRLKFRVVPGSTLTINGQAVRTDPVNGEATATQEAAPIPIEGTTALTDNYAVRVVAPTGEVVTGTYSLRVPRTALAIDRVPRTVITTAPQLALRGRAPGAQRVTLDGAPLAVENDAFTAVVPLATNGHHVASVIAWSTGAAPALARVEIDRIAPGDRAALLRDAGDVGLGAAQLAAGTLGPGNRVHVHGRVLGAPRERDGGRTYQLVVIDRPCLPGRCLLWVDTEAGVPVTDGATVEIAGTVSGRRPFVAADGSRRNDPVVYAGFVL